MKAIIHLICIGSLALAVPAWGKENHGKSTAAVKSKARTAAVQKSAPRMARQSIVRSGGVKSFRSSSNAQFRQRSYKMTPRSTGNAVVRQGNFQKKFSNQAISRENRLITKRARLGSDVAVNRGLNVNRQRNFNFNRDRNFAVNRNRNGTINNNWRGQQFSGQNYSAFRNYSRTWHDRYWWRSHYPRITFYFGAPYYWDAGYWYPAWGYYPDYVYEYDGPIYGYNDLAPDQVVLDVQVRLQREGYYNGPIDGLLGPMTRQAITAFQADHGLAVTSSIDRPTLATLGLT